MQKNKKSKYFAYKFILDGIFSTFVVVVEVVMELQRIISEMFN